MSPERLAAKLRNMARKSKETAAESVRTHAKQLRDRVSARTPVVSGDLAKSWRIPSTSAGFTLRNDRPYARRATDIEEITKEETDRFVKLTLNTLAKDMTNG